MSTWILCEQPKKNHPPASAAWDVTPWAQVYGIRRSFTSFRYSWLGSSWQPSLDLSVGHLSYSGLYIVKLGLFTCFCSHFASHLKGQINTFEEGRRDRDREKEAGGRGRERMCTVQVPWNRKALEDESRRILSCDDSGRLTKKLFLAPYPL